jgi:hypothetical protein
MKYASGSVMKRGTAYPAKASGAETASTTGPTIEVADTSMAIVTVAVSAASGTTPTMTVVVEGSSDATNWFTIGTIGANGYASGSVGTAPSNFTTAATVAGVFPCPQYIRTRSVIAGTTPSFTYSVNVEASGGV